MPAKDIPIPQQNYTQNMSIQGDSKLLHFRRHVNEKAVRDYIVHISKLSPCIWKLIRAKIALSTIHNANVEANVVKWFDNI